MPIYNITYYLNGGVNNPSNPATFDSATDLPVTLLDPTREGYTFDGWYRDPDFINGPDSSIDEAGDEVFYAKWAINQYTLEFVDHDASVLQTADYDFGADLSAVTAPVDPTREGYTFAGWDSSVPATMPANTVTITATYTINSYNLEFQDHDGSVLSSTDYDFGADLSSAAPVDPTRIGYTFNAWDPVVPATMPANDITITATYSINEYTITFDSNEGSAVTALTQDYATTVVEPTEPTRDGYEFTGWFSDEALTTPYVFDTMPAENITLYAGWDIVTYTITYINLFGIEHTNPATFVVTDLDITLTAPTETPNHSFAGWFSDPRGLTEVESITSTGDKVLYAMWDLLGDFVSLPVVPNNPYDYRINKNFIVQILPVRILENNYRVQVIISPGTLKYFAETYTTYAEASNVAQAYLSLIGQNDLIIDAGPF